VYRPPTDEEREKRLYGFGDLFAAPWMAGLVLRWDSVPLRMALGIVDGQQVEVLLPQDPSTVRGRTFPKDIILAHASDPEDLALGHGAHGILAVAVSDDCDFAGRVETPRGRFRFAPVSKLGPPGSQDREKALKTEAFDRYPIPPQTEEPVLDGGVMEFGQTFSVAAVDVFERATWLGRISDPEVRAKVQFRWSAHATRHGPDAARDTAEKLARLITANGDPEAVKRERGHGPLPMSPSAEAIVKPLTRLLLIPWLVEGPQADAIGLALERGDPYQPYVEALLESLREIGPAAADAVAALEAAARGGDAG
jgi:hypothetical protein